MHRTVQTSSPAGHRPIPVIDIDHEEPMTLLRTSISAMLSPIDDEQLLVPFHALCHCNIHVKKPSVCVDPAVPTPAPRLRNLERRRARTLDGRIFAHSRSQPHMGIAEAFAGTHAQRASSAAVAFSPLRRSTHAVCSRERA